MRSTIVKKNLISSIVLQLTAALSGFILPHLIISVYGSSTNGMITSITQYLSYLAMVEAGVRASSLIELYKPLAENDEAKRNQILSATRSFYTKSGIVYTICLLGLMWLYPLLVKGQVDTNTARWMILILASSNIVDYYILGKYQVLLAADQKTHIIYFVQSIGTILNLVVSVILIYCEKDILFVKLSGTVIYALRSIVIVSYVRRKYHNINFRVKTKGTVLPQRWNALVHQFAGVVCNNTDLVLITLLLGAKSMAEASVYYVYNLASSMFTSLFNSVSSAIIPYFGNMLVKKEDDRAQYQFDLMEYIYLIIIFTIYTCMYSLMMSFVGLYTKGATDANYNRQILAVLFVIMGVIQNIRIPSMIIICAAGHYKETQSRAIIEAGINLLTSIVLISTIGIEGAVIGTICAFLYRSVDSVIYCARFFMKQSLSRTIARAARNGLMMIIMCIGMKRIHLVITSWMDFVLYGCIMTIVVGGCFVLVNSLFEMKKSKEIIQLIRKS